MNMHACLRKMSRKRTLVVLNINIYIYASGLHEQSCSDLFLTCQISCNFKGTIAFGNIKDYLPSVKNPRDKKAHPEREVRSVVHAQRVKI